MANIVTNQPKRCAIYTRKSTEDGLEQEFNSLDAQREACEAYIASQKFQGWQVLPTFYDDGGFSGGNVERPALKQLLDDIKLRKIDIVVVYKIDRLSRSLFDFVQLAEMFDEYGVSFVSVTQHFNTAEAIGRLLLNVLMSFAQYEREISAERVRDKIAASKRKGLWMGGMPPLGYDLKDRRLVINPEEAGLVRHIFNRQAQIGSSTLLIKELNREGYRTKRYTSVKGNTRGGTQFSKQSLYKILNNRIYLGEIVHKDKSFAGMHEPILDKALWDKVHNSLSENRIERTDKVRLSTVAPLKGLIFDHLGGAMIMKATHKSRNRHYRYYVPSQAIQCSYQETPIKQIPAGEIESIVLHYIGQVVQTPKIVSQVIAATNLFDPDDNDETKIINELKQFDEIWRNLFPVEQHRLIQLMVKRVVIGPHGIDIQMKTNGLTHLLEQLKEAA